MWPDRVSNPGPPTYESGAQPTALRGPAVVNEPSVFEPLKVYFSLVRGGVGVQILRKS